MKAHHALCLFAAVVMPALPAFAQQKTKVHFNAGNDNAAVEGSIKGHHYHDYILGAKAGQRMGVSLITEGNAFFNILPPGSDGVAIYNSSGAGNDATNIILPNDGNYTIRVYLMGDAKDSNKTVKYMVSTTIMN
jgi:hypothetical protein